MTENDKQLTSKAQRTRQRIFEVAIDQFVQKGYEETTMRDIATAADCSLGLAYRYFDSKEALVLRLWQQSADDFVKQIAELDKDNFTERYYQALHQKIEQLEPYRGVMQATIGAAMNPRSGVAIISPETSWYRDAILEALEDLVMNSSDAPREDRSKQIAMIMYGVHLLMTLVWIYDTSAQQNLTQTALNFMRDTMKLLRPLLMLPPVTRTLAKLALLMEGIFVPEKTG